jgi:hypothetical protein
LVRGTLKLEGFVTAARCDTACNANWVPGVLATRLEDWRAETPRVGRLTEETCHRNVSTLAEAPFQRLALALRSVPQDSLSAHQAAGARKFLTKE